MRSLSVSKREGRPRISAQNLALVAAHFEKQRETAKLLAKADSRISLRERLLQKLIDQVALMGLYP